MEELTLAEKCEHLMNIVVESRKQFGKMCRDYEQKTSLVENKMLNLQLKTIRNCQFKNKTHNSIVNTEEMNNSNEIRNEIAERQRRMDELRKNLTATQSIVRQLQNDPIGKKLQREITAEVLLAEAKSKIIK